MYFTFFIEPAYSIMDSFLLQGIRYLVQRLIGTGLLIDEYETDVHTILYRTCWLQPALGRVSEFQGSEVM